MGQARKEGASRRVFNDVFTDMQVRKREREREDFGGHRRFLGGNVDRGSVTNSFTYRIARIYYYVVCTEKQKKRYLEER